VNGLLIQTLNVWLLLSSLIMSSDIQWKVNVWKNEYIKYQEQKFAQFQRDVCLKVCVTTIMIKLKHLLKRGTDLTMSLSHFTSDINMWSSGSILHLRLGNVWAKTKGQDIYDIYSLQCNLQECLLLKLFSTQLSNICHQVLPYDYTCFLISSPAACAEAKICSNTNSTHFPYFHILFLCKG